MPETRDTGARARAASLRRRLSLPAVILACGLLFQLGWSLYFTHDGWLGVDGLYYISQRGGLPGEHTSIFAAYAGHWQPVLITIYLTLWWLVGLHTYVPYVLMAILAHLAICLLSYLVLRRLAVGPWVALVASWLLLFYGTGGEAWLADAPFALTSTVALGYAAIYLLVRWPDHRWAPWVASGFLVLSLGFSITSVVVGVLVGLFVLGSRGLRPAVQVAGPAALVFAVWFLVAGRNGGRVQITLSNLLDVPGRALSALTVPLGDVVGVASAGALLTILVVVVALVAPVSSPGLRSLALAGIGAAAVQMCLSVVANFNVGQDAVLVGRYRYVVMAMLVPAVALTLQVATERARRELGSTVLLARVVAVLGVVALTVIGVNAQRSQAAFSQAVAGEFESYMRGTIAATDLGERMLTGDVPDRYMSGVDFMRLAAPELRHKLTIGKATAEERLKVENTLYVAVHTETLSLPAPTELQSVSFDRALSQEFGCETYTANTFTPFITMSSFDGAQIAVTSQSDVVRTRVVRDEIELPPRTWDVVPGETIYIGTSAQLAELQIAFDAGGEFTICRG